MKFSAAELNHITRAVQREQQRRLLRRHHAFTKGAWSVIEPGTPFKDNWHLHAISDHLEQVSAGHIRTLIINIPPRHMKSIGASVTWTPWEWGPNGMPSRRFLYSSYAGSLSVRDSLKARRIIQSAWYRELWGDAFELCGDQNAKLRFENSKTGYRLATSVGGLGTGEGGDIVAVDDPHNVQEAESEAVRTSTVDWWSATMSTRVNDPETGAFVIIMQRVHEGDVTGFELKERADDFKSQLGECVHLCLPARFEVARRCATYVNGVKFFEDPRTKEGELLWPERFSDRAVKTLEKKLGEYGAAGQLQQRPAPIGGGLLKPKFVRLWPAEKSLPRLVHVIQSYDTAYTEKTTGDPTAMLALGIFEHRGQHRVLLLDAWQEHLHYPALRKRAKEDFKAWYGDDDSGAYATKIVVEEKSSGQSLLQDLRLANLPVFAYNPGRADKVARAEVAAPYLEAGLFYMLESKQDPGMAVSWARFVLKDFEGFPNSDDDHSVDCFTQAIIYLRDAGFLRIDAIDIEDEEDYDTKRRGNPYAR